MSAWRRPDYKKLGVLKQQFPDVPIIALTATATKRVCDDLKSMLRIEACESFSASVNRPNLLYEVTVFPSIKLTPWRTATQFMLSLNKCTTCKK